MASNVDTPGTLWIVATPLGNPGDLSPRARECLEAADIVLAEDTRRESLACARWGVRVRRFVSFHDHNEKDKAPAVLEWLRDGKNIALISDAGMPVLADPGYGIVRSCREAGLPVSVVPGPCAPVVALAGSGIAPQPFVFFGFLPRGHGDQKKALAPYAHLACTLVFFERRDRLGETLALAHAVLGPREACVARELTKTHEEFIRFRLEAPPDFSQILGEVTVVIGQPEQAIRSPEEEVRAVLGEELHAGGAPRSVAKRAQARLRGWTSSEVYAILNGMKTGQQM